MKEEQTLKISLSTAESCPLPPPPFTPPLHMLQKTTQSCKRWLGGDSVKHRQFSTEPVPKYDIDLISRYLLLTSSGCPDCIYLFNLPSTSACSTLEVGNTSEEFKPAAPNIACPLFLPVKRECEKSGLNSVRDERFLLFLLSLGHILRRRKRFNHVSC